MPRYVFQAQFLGTHFCGSQKQLKARTVQAELEKAFSIFFRADIKVILASRVDAGVHALAMIGHCDLLQIPTQTERQICRHLNGILPADLGVLSFRQAPVPGFHAIRDAIKRHYVYKLRDAAPKQPLDSEQVAYIKEPLCLEKLQDQVQILHGRHDFSGICKASQSRSSPICEVFEINWRRKTNGLLIFEISACHFLYNMIRLIIGTQIASQNGKVCANSLKYALEQKNRLFLGPPAPAKGFFCFW